MNYYSNNPYESSYEPTQRALQGNADAPTLYAPLTPDVQANPYSRAPHEPQAPESVPGPYPYSYPVPPPPPNLQNSFAPPPGPRRSTGRRVGFIVLASLLILVGLLIAIVLPLHVSQANRVNTTATVQAKATAQVRQATATAQMRATATAIATTYPFSADVKLRDPLTDNNQGYGWTTSQTCTFTGGAYHVIEAQNNTYATCPASNTAFNDFTYQVSMQILKGDIGGITFRGDDDNNKYYVFAFGPDGSYVLWNYSQASNPKTLQAGSATAFKVGLGQTNVLAVVARGSSLSLYVNQQKLATVTDRTYRSGQIGVVGYDTSSTADIAFTNAEIWAL